MGNFPLLLKTDFYTTCLIITFISVTDPDDDVIRCRYADYRKKECPEEGSTKACGLPTDGLTIQVNVKKVIYIYIYIYILDLELTKRKSIVCTYIKLFLVFGCF